jgi:hypothetical protein
MNFTYNSLKNAREALNAGHVVIVTNDHEAFNYALLNGEVKCLADGYIDTLTLDEFEDPKNHVVIRYYGEGRNIEAVVPDTITIDTRNEAIAEFKDGLLALEDMMAE